MDVGIGLPNAVRGVGRDGIVEWARRAEQAGFASLGTIDRLLYPSYEPLIALAAAAAVTERIRLVTDILIAPLRANTALLAKQAATLDHLSGGRLELGLAVGGREDDFEASGVDFATRGAAFERQLEELVRLWDDADRVAPSLGGRRRPGLLVGGRSPAAFRRAARYADGWTLGGGTPDALRDGRASAVEQWRAAGRDGEPRTIALMYYSLGEHPEEAARRSLGHYYAWLGEHAEGVVQGAAKDADTLKDRLSAFERAGADEVICFPASPDPEQVELLARAIDS